LVKSHSAKIDFSEWYPGMGEQLVGGWTFVFNDKKTQIVPYKPLPQSNLEDVPVSERQAAVEADWEHFKTLVQEDAKGFPVGYAAYDFRYLDTKSGYNAGDAEDMPMKTKLITVTWAPDNLKPRMKMLVPSSVANVTGICDGFTTMVQLSDMDDAMYASVAEKAKIKL